MKLGDTFYLEDWAGGHLNFILEVFADESIMVCNFTDYSNHSDKTCLVDAKDHPDLTKRSAVNFRKAYCCTTETSRKALERLVCENKQPLSKELLARIKQGAIDSPFTPPDLKELLRKK